VDPRGVILHHRNTELKWKEYRKLFVYADIEKASSENRKFVLERWKNG
jgi:hypothetical protein